MKGEIASVYPYLWQVGDAGFVAPERVVAAGRFDSAPIRKATRRARNEGRLIDLTFGRACKWVLYLDTGHLVLATQPIPSGIDRNLNIDTLIKKMEAY